MANGENGTGLEEFLHPQSMLTPGVAGAMTTLITNALVTQFHLLPNYTGLAISCGFGLVVFKGASAIPIWQKTVYFLLNSLVIFSVAMGTNQAGVRIAEARQPSSPPADLAKASPPTPFFSDWLDGTTTKRAELVSDLTKVDESHAEDALKTLHLEVSPSASAAEVLKWHAATARTAGEVEAIGLAVDKARQLDEQRNEL